MSARPSRPMSFGAEVALKRKSTQFFDIHRSHDIYFRSTDQQGVLSNDINSRVRFNPNAEDCIHEFVQATGGTDIGPYFMNLIKFSLDADVNIQHNEFLNGLTFD